MNLRSSCTTLVCLMFLCPLPALAMTHYPYSSGNPLTLLAKNEGPSAPGEDRSEDSPLSVQDYEKEKLAGLKRNIGRRLLTVRTLHPAEFYESPDDLGKRVRVKNEKEGFVIVEVVQNQSGTMNFYQVKFDTETDGLFKRRWKVSRDKSGGGEPHFCPEKSEGQGKHLESVEGLNLPSH